jgi:hypothetical protein
MVAESRKPIIVGNAMKTGEKQVVSANIQY